MEIALYVLLQQQLLSEVRKASAQILNRVKNIRRTSSTQAVLDSDCLTTWAIFATTSIPAVSFFVPNNYRELSGPTCGRVYFQLGCAHRLCIVRGESERRCIRHGSRRSHDCLADGSNELSNGHWSPARSEGLGNQRQKEKEALTVELN